MGISSRIGKLSLFLLSLKTNYSYLIIIHVKMLCLCFALSFFFYLFDLVGNLAHEATNFLFVNKPLF
jgi:hypothetical protein